MSGCEERARCGAGGASERRTMHRWSSRSYLTVSERTTSDSNSASCYDDSPFINPRKPRADIH